MKTNVYIPKPIDTSNVEVPPELLQLVEILAQNVHENWAAERINLGWKFGHERNDLKKEHPCLIPYEELPEDEKEFDKKTAIATIRVILGMGYLIKKIA